MKRSAQVALLLGGLTVAGAGAYAMTPPRRDCLPAQPAGAGAVPAPSPSGGITVVPGTTPAPAAQPAQPCGRSRRWGSWGPSYYGGSRSSRSTWPSSDRSGSPTPTRTTMAPTSRGTTRTTTTTSRSGSSRGGFGSTGRSAGRSSS